jgi:addiction module HigA family antidote
MKKKTLHPVHPGEILLEEFLKPMGLSQNKLAVSIGVPARRINEIVLEKRKISADTALRLGRFLERLLNSGGLQSQYDLDIAADALGTV